MSKITTMAKAPLIFKNWPLYFIDYFKLAKDNNLIYKLRNGVKYKARAGTADRGIISEIWLYRYYTPPGFEIKEKDVVVDIGAQIGVFSVFASKHAKKGKIFSFEPTPENFKILKDNIKLNNIKNILPVNKAVSDREGKKCINLSDENTGKHSFIFSDEGRKNKIEVRTTSLNKFMENMKISRINFLKIDCEGAEYEILFSCPAETLRKIDKISMEYHDIDEKRNSVKLKGFLEKQGFKVRLTDNFMLYASR